MDSGLGSDPACAPGHAADGIERGLYLERLVRVADDL